eukprot:4761574-Pleurochrysis_carterae.AAC.2
MSSALSKKPPPSAMMPSRAPAAARQPPLASRAPLDAAKARAAFVSHSPYSPLDAAAESVRACRARLRPRAFRTRTAST